MRDQGSATSAVPPQSVFASIECDVVGQTMHFDSVVANLGGRGVAGALWASGTRQERTGGVSGRRRRSALLESGGDGVVVEVDVEVLGFLASRRPCVVGRGP